MSASYRTGRFVTPYTKSVDENVQSRICPLSSLLAIDVPLIDSELLAVSSKKTTRTGYGSRALKTDDADNPIQPRFLHDIGIVENR